MIVFEEAEGATMITVLGLKMRENGGVFNKKRRAGKIGETMINSVQIHGV